MDDDEMKEWLRNECIEMALCGLLLLVCVTFVAIDGYYTLFKPRPAVAQPEDKKS